MTNTTQNIIEEAIKRFNAKFVNKVIKQVDTSNSIELPLWKNNHSHLSVEVADFLSSELSTAITTTKEGVVREILGLSHYKRDDSGLDWVIQVTDIEKLLSTLKGNHEE